MAGTWYSQVALVTGGESGIGRASTLTFVREGAGGVVTDVSAEGNAAMVPMLEEAGDDASSIIMERLAQGDRAAFWQIWSLYHDDLSCCCRRWMGGNVTEAEEALSRAMLKAWRKLPVYAEEITNPKAWLTRMTRNLCLDCCIRWDTGSRRLRNTARSLSGSPK